MITQSPTARRNSTIFGVSMLILHIAVCIIYGLCDQSSFAVINISSVVFPIFLGLLTIAGFGLLFSYLKRLAWSGLGFAFLITALAIEFYPLANAFWIKAGIQDNPNTGGFGGRQFTLLLSNNQVTKGSNYSNTITTCFRCALSILAAFSCILGRAGALECLILSIFGTFGFELNRQIISNLGQDSFGTFSIFTFGGFLGLTVGLLLRKREEGTDNCSTVNHLKNNGSYGNVALSAMGALIIFVFIPVLSVDIDTYHGINAFNRYTGPLSVIFAMGFSIIASLIVSVLINGHLIARDLINAPLAGAIIVGASSFFITNNVFSIVIGFVGGALQAALQNAFEKNPQNKPITSTFSWSLFGIQGLVGAVFATGFRESLEHEHWGITHSAQSINFNAGYELLIAVISAGIGIGIGLLAGALIYCVNSQLRDRHFEDGEYWMNSDGISYAKEDLVQVELKGHGVTSSPMDPLDDEADIRFEDVQDDAKDNHAYL